MPRETCRTPKSTGPAPSVVPPFAAGVAAAITPRPPAG